MNSTVIANDFSLITGERNKWKTFVTRAIEKNQLRACTCPAYSPEMASKTGDDNEMCRCGHLLRNHDLEHVFEKQGAEGKRAQLNTFVRMLPEYCGSLASNVRVRNITYSPMLDIPEELIYRWFCF